jgi:hypothetical protein
MAGGGPQDHQAPAGVVDDLRVDAPCRAVQGARQEVAEGRTGVGRHPPHDGEPWMEVHGGRALFTFDDQAFHQHGLSIGALQLGLEDFFTNASRNRNETTVSGGDLPLRVAGAIRGGEA